MNLEMNTVETDDIKLIQYSFVFLDRAHCVHFVENFRVHKILIRNIGLSFLRDESVP